MSKLLIIFITILTLNANSSNSVKIYTKLDEAPYSYIDKNKKLKGIYSAVLESIFDKMPHFKLEQEKIDFNVKSKKEKKKLKKRLEKRDFLALNGIYYKPEKYPYIEKYSDPIFYENIILICNKKTLEKKRAVFPDDFRDLNISKSKNISIDENITIKDREVTKELIFDLADNKEQCYIGNDMILWQKLHKLKNSDKNISDKLKSIKNALTISRESVHIGFSNQENIYKKHLIKKINLAIKVMTNSSEIEEIIEQYTTDVFTNQTAKNIEAITYNWGGSYVSDKFDTLGLIPEIVSLALKDVNIDVNYDLKSSQHSYLLTKWEKRAFSFPYYKTKEIEKYMTFSNPIMFSEVVLLFNKNRFPNGIRFKDFNDLKNYKIGGVKGYFYEDIFKKYNLNYTLTRNFEELIELFVFDKVDIIPSNLKVFIDIVRKKYPDKLEHFNFHSKKNFSSEPVYIIFPKSLKSSEDLREAFNTGFENIKNKNILKKIFLKYGLSGSEYKTNIEKLSNFLKKRKKPQNNIDKFIAKVKKSKKVEKKVVKKSVKTTNKPVYRGKSAKLYIETDPIDSKIQILNYKGRFKQGIKIRKGTYRVVISKEGYITLNKKLIITQNETIRLKFTLKKDK